MEFSMKDFWNGNRRALARAITIVENERDGYEDIMKDIYHHTGRAQVIGITGAPGAVRRSQHTVPGSCQSS